MNATNKTIEIVGREDNIRDLYWRAYFAALEGLRSDFDVDADVADIQADLSAKKALARAGITFR